MMMALATDRYDVVGSRLKKLGGMRAIANDCSTWKRDRVGARAARPWRGRREGRRLPHRERGPHALHVRRGGHRDLDEVDAALHIALGRPDQARITAVIGQSAWARVVEAEAALELGDAAGALAAAERGAKGDARPAAFATRVVEQQARAVLGKGKDREAALAELARLADAAKTQRARHALGAAYFAIGDLAAAKRDCGVRSPTSATSPDPSAFAPACCSARSRSPRATCRSLPTRPSRRSQSTRRTTARRSCRRRSRCARTPRTRRSRSSPRFASSAASHRPASWSSRKR